MIAYLLMELTDSTLVAPGISLATFGGLTLLAVRAYKEARQIDVEGERKRRIESEAREKTTSETNTAELHKLITRVKSLEDKIDELRTDKIETIERMRIQHESELLDERGKNYQLRRLLRENGVEIPEELGPA